MEWNELYGPKTKPAFAQLMQYFQEDVRELFSEFNGAMNGRYGVYNKYQRYEKSAGWVYGYCRNYRCELLCVRIGGGRFNVLGVTVEDRPSLEAALLEAERAYGNGYEARYAEISAAKKSRQLDRAKVRIEREKSEMKQLAESADPELLNKMNWSRKLQRRKLALLYESDARGVRDYDLLDEVGFAFYSRCAEARQARNLMEHGRMLCHGCRAELAASSYTAPAKCGCGRIYTYREYRRSFNAANMPAGRATPIFDAFAEKWPRCGSYEEKLTLIDGLVHECHISVMSGNRGRSVCVNLIEGTHRELRELLEGIAGSTDPTGNTRA